ncbi:hypothetical protein [Nocardia tengchongensis]|uniref:hypothetical protein n=1 Tax=Nocardia tengchongensis TaxID=2055889 RepID=UPI0036198D52
MTHFGRRAPAGSAGSAGRAPHRPQRRTNPGDVLPNRNLARGDGDASRILEAFGRGRFRTDDEILACFGTLAPDEDGLRPCVQWRAEDADGHEPELTVWEQLVVGGMARKP